MVLDPGLGVRLRRVSRSEAWLPCIHTCQTGFQQTDLEKAPESLETACRPNSKLLSFSQLTWQTIHIRVCQHCKVRNTNGDSGELPWCLQVLLPMLVRSGMTQVGSLYIQTAFWFFAQKRGLASFRTICPPCPFRRAQIALGQSPLRWKPPWKTSCSTDECVPL